MQTTLFTRSREVIPVRSLVPPALKPFLPFRRKRVSLLALPILVALLAVTAAAQSVRIVTTVAGRTRSPYGNGGPAAQAIINYSDAIAADSAGNLYIADTLDHQIRRIDASTGIISAVAGIGQPGYSGDGQLAANAQLNFPGDVAVNTAGNVYIADTGNNVIRKVSAATGIITTIAGTAGYAGYSGDGSAATAALLNHPEGVAVDASGNVYIADSGNDVVREVTAAGGIITTVAGTPERADLPGGGDGGPATQATFGDPIGVALDLSGNLYISDQGNCVIRKVAASTAIITTYAGNNNCGNSGDDGPATSAQLGWDMGHASPDAAGNLYIADYSNNVIRKVTASTGIITTLAGNGGFGFSGDGGPATYAALNNPQGVAAAPNGAIYIADRGNLRIRQVAADGTISTIAGNGTTGPVPNAVSATSTPIGIYGYPWFNSVYADALGNFYFADGMNNVIRRVTAAGVISTIAGTGEAGYSGDGGLATSAELSGPASLAFDAQGNLYIADNANNVVRKVDAATGIISTYAGTYTQSSSVMLAVTGDGGPATSAGLPQPTGLALDSSGNLYIAEMYQCVVRKVTTAGVISTFAGQTNSCADFLSAGGDGGQATNAQLSAYAGSIAIDAQNNLYIGDWNRVREVAASTGIITTVAGTNGQGAYNYGDGSPALSAIFSQIYGVAVDAGGNLYIADTQAIRVVNSAGIISTVAGQDDRYGYSGDGDLAASALASPEGMAVDASGNIYFSDSYGNRIRKVSTATSIQPAAATPTFTPAAGTYDGSQTITLSTTTPGAQIFYTFDGTTPIPGFSSLYTGPLSLVGTVNLSAIVIAPGFSTSDTASATFTVGQASSPSVTFSPSNLTFVSQAIGTNSAPQGITLTNSGNSVLSLTSITTSGDFYQHNNCGSTLDSGASCSISVVFAPTAAGTRTGTLILTDNAAGSPQTATLSGTGRDMTAPAPAVEFTPTELDFGSQAVGSTSAAQTVTLTNSGNAALTISSIEALGDFKEANTCGTTVGAGAGCTISVSFAPTISGAVGSAITVTDNAANSPQTVTLTGTGADVAIASTSTGLSATPGGSTTASIQISSAGGFSGTVNLTCSVAYLGTGTPQNAPTCSLNPAQASVSSGTPATATLTVNTTGSGGSARLNNEWLHLGGRALATLFLFIGLPRRRWRKLGLLLFVFGAITTGAAIGCSGGSSTAGTGGSQTPSSPGTTTGNYRVTVTATNGTASAETMSITIPLTVQ